MGMIDPTIMAQLKRDGLLRDGHFAFRSGRHTEVLLNRDLLLADPLFASHMGYTLAKRFFTDKVEIVAAPSIWGAGLAQWVGYFLDPKAKVVYATPKYGELTIAAQLEGFINDCRILLIDNLMVSGETMTNFAGTIEGLGGTVIGIGTLWNVGVEEVGGRPVFGLINTAYDAFAEDECPQCLKGNVTPELVDY
jgi:orotate phosphoribosyltransferase